MDPRVSIYNIEGFENAENGHVEDMSESARSANKDRWCMVGFVSTCSASSVSREAEVD